MSDSSTTTESDLIEPIHPGEILMEDFSRASGSLSLDPPTATSLRRYTPRAASNHRL